MDWTTGQTPFFRAKYYEHIKSILNLINTKTNRTQNELNFPHTIKNVEIIKKQMIQHLFTYQTQIDFKLYDTYREIIKHPSKMGLEYIDLLRNFVRVFINLIEKANLETDEIFGSCDECLKKLSWKDKRKYNKILREKEESDPNAWDDSKW